MLGSFTMKMSETDEVNACEKVGTIILVIVYMYERNCETQAFHLFGQMRIVLIKSLKKIYQVLACTII